LVRVANGKNNSLKTDIFPCCKSQVIGNFSPSLESMLKIILLTLFSFAPADSLRTETVNGKLFIVHQVSAGETLYAISKRYKISVDIIKKANETIEAGIKEGQLIRIPYEKKEKKTVTTEIKEKQPEQKTHTVASKETLSYIAKQYKLTVKQLKELNSK